MAENKTKATKVSVADFVKKLKDETKEADAKTLIKLMADATGEKATMWGPSIIGFGSYHYKYDSGREGDMPIVGFSPRSSAHVLYVRAGSGALDLLLPKLGKYKTGGGCLYVKKLADVNLKVLSQIIKKSAASIGKH